MSIFGKGSEIMMAIQALIQIHGAEARLADVQGK